MYATFDLPQDPIFMLDNVRAAIAGQQNLLQAILAKPFKSPDDIRNIQFTEQELQRLLASERSYLTALLNMPSSSSDSFLENAALSNVFQPTCSFTGDFAEGSSSISPQEYPMELDIPYTYPWDLDFTTTPLSADPSFFDSFVPHSTRKMSIDHNATEIAYSTIAQSPTFVDQNANEGVQVLVSTQLPAGPPPTQTTSALQNTNHSYNNPQSCSSKLLPVPTHESEDEYLDDSDDEGSLLNPTEYLNRIGVEAPLPMPNDAVDDNGDYYGRGHDLFDGPRAAHDDWQKFLIQAGNAEVFDGNERVEDALKFLGLKNLNDVLPGMEVSLMAHQAMGVKWMLEKERSDYKGGCLADEMGLGKTIQMIATILKNQPTDPACKTTLIVAPLALLDQWKIEIETKTNCGLACLIYHGPSKTLSKKQLLQHDLVLTTFSTLALEWPDFETEMQKKKRAKKNGDVIVSDDDENMKDFAYRTQKRKEKAGLLFQVEFFRVILDEAQYIRNRRTRISRALSDIQATHRWCLTGTPIVNTLVDAYGYLRFLKIRPWYDWDEFNSRIARNERKRPGLAITRLHAVMGTFLLRRRKDTKLDGEAIIKLPQKEIKLVKLEFSQEERDIYNMVEARNQATFNRYLREGTVLKNYHHVLVLLLRLRQICSHPSLIAEDGHADVLHHESDEDFRVEFANELTRARRLVSDEFVSKMKEKFKREALARIEAEKESTNAGIEEEDCPICFDAMTDAVLTACGHFFCRECIVNFLNSRPVAGDAVDHRCPCCRAPLDTKKLFSRSAFEPTDKDLDPSLGTDIGIAFDDDDILSHKKGKGKTAVTAGRKMLAESEYEGDDNPDDDLSDFIVQTDEDEDEKDATKVLQKRFGKKRDEIDTPEEKEVLFGVRDKDVSNEAIKQLRFFPSSKMKYMMNELGRLFRTKPDEKTLVVSQWTSCLDFVSKYLSQEGIPHVKYQGDMNRVKREQAVKVFMSKEKARVMLMSLKCGGIGLNLTRANNVISLDLGWSFATESQAFDRVHRMGQTRNVLVQRIVIADTVEDRILQMQERKKTFAEGILGEGSSKKMGRLTINELANLFGLDARGRVLKD